MRSKTDYIKSKISTEQVVDLIESHGGTCTIGGNYIRSTCPIHGGDNPTAFVYHIETHLWTCHTQCGNGDIFTLVSELYDLDTFPKAVDMVCAMFKIDLAGVDFDESDQANEQRRWLKYYAIKEEKRQPFTMQMFGECIRLSYRELDALYSPSFNRYIFPVRDVDGRIVGASCRTADDTVKPKWVHYPRGLKFSSILYGIKRGHSKVYVCEGIIDALRLESFGVHAVCTFGCHLSRAQVNLLIENYDEIIMAYDNDSAGITGTNNAIRMLKNKINVKVLILNDYNDVGEIERKEDFEELKVISWNKFVK